MSVTKQSASDMSRADKCGLSKVRLDSAWWGNEKFGQWENVVWALIDHETEDAYHVAMAADSPRAGGMRLGPESIGQDVWLPKSKVTVEESPDWDVYAPSDDVKGEVYVSGVVGTKYGAKAALWGDTYQAMKEDGVSDEIPFHKDGVGQDAHHTFNGTCWCCDQNAVDMVAEALADAGYVVKVSPAQS